MRGLTVLYDARCRLCCGARRWLESQPKYVGLEFVAAATEEAVRRFPGLDPDATLRVLHVVSDEGGVYSGAKAWVMCLWALQSYRSMAARLASPTMLPMARRFVLWVSRHRLSLGVTGS